MRRPLLFPCLVFIAGIVLAEKIPFSIGQLWLLLAGFLPLAWILRGRAPFGLILLFVIFILAQIDHHLEVSPPPGNIAYLPIQKETRSSIIGIVDSSIRRGKWGKNWKQTFTLRVHSVKQDRKTFRVRGKIKCTILGTPQLIRYGDLLRLWGELNEPRGATNPGEFDYRHYLSLQGIYRQLLVIGEKNSRILERGQGNRVEGWIERVREWVAAHFDRLLSETESAFLKAFLIGEQGDISYEIREQFVNTGTIHVFAISGLNIALMAGCWYTFWRWCLLPQKWNAVLTLGVIFIYTQLAGLRIPVTRAALMGALYYGSLVLGRERDSINNLAFAALGLLLISSQYFYHISFQLSFLCVLALILFTSPIERWFGFLPWPFLRRSFSVSFATLLGAGVLICFYFSTFSPIGLLANVVIVPLVTMIILGGFLLLATGDIPGLGMINIAFVKFSVSAMLWLVEWFSKIPFGHWHIPKPSLLIVLGYYGVLAMFWWGRNLLQDRRKAWVLAGLSVVIMIALAMTYKQKSCLSITALDIKQAGVYFLKTSDQKSILVNAGPGKKPEVGRWILVPFLKNQGLSRIDAFVLTDWAKRSWSALPLVQKTFRVGRCFIPGHGTPHKEFSFDTREAEFYRMKNLSEIAGLESLDLESIVSASGKTGLLAHWEGKKILFLPSVDEKLVSLLRESVSAVTVVFLHVAKKDEKFTAALVNFLQQLNPKLLILSGATDHGFWQENLPDTKVLGTFELGAITVSIDADRMETDSFLRIGDGPRKSFSVLPDVPVH